LIYSKKKKKKNSSITAETTTGCIIAGSALGERGKSAEIVGREAANELINNLAYGGCVDE